MGKGNFQGRQYESVYYFHLDDLVKLYFDDSESVDSDNGFSDDSYNDYENAVIFAVNNLKEYIKNNATLNNHFAVIDKNKWLSRNKDDFSIIAESDFYKIVIQDDGVILIVALLIDDNAYNYDLSESDIENKLKESYKDIDNALRKMLLGFAIDLYKPCGAWTSGKVSDNG